MRTGPTRLGNILSSVVARLGVERNLDDYRLWSAWDEIVGPGIARNAQPLRLDARRLVVVVRSNVWMQELSMLRRELCQRLNDWMGREVISEIFLVVGKVEAKQPERQGPKRIVKAPLARFQQPEPLPHGPETRERLTQAIERLWRAARGED